MEDHAEDILVAVVPVAVDVRFQREHDLRYPLHLDDTCVRQRFLHR